MFLPKGSRIEFQTGEMAFENLEALLETSRVEAETSGIEFEGSRVGFETLWQPSERFGARVDRFWRRSEGFRQPVGRDQMMPGLLDRERLLGLQQPDPAQGLEQGAVVERWAPIGPS